MNLQNILIQAGKLKIAVIGDLIEDIYIKGTVERISPEAPVPVLLQREQYTSLGGAGNVWKNLLNLGVDAHLYCNCNIWSQELISDNIHINEYPHAKKIRMMAGTQQLLRVDVETPYDAIEWQTFEHFSWWENLADHFGEYDCICMVDYKKGVLSDSLINGIMEIAEKLNSRTVVDAKDNFGRFAGATVIKCNQKEWQESRDHESVSQWRVVTCGEVGISYYDMFGRGQGVGGYPINIVDVCGAGDTVTAILAIGAAINQKTILSIEDTIELANIAASEVCMHPGVYPITKSDLLKRYEEVKGYFTLKSER